VHTFLAACADGRGVETLELVTPPVRPAFVEAGTTIEACGELLGVTDAPQLDRQIFRQAAVEEVDARGGFATARVRVPAGPPVVLELESTGETWLIARSPALQVPDGPSESG
jgi:hypothetical protein